VRLLQTRTILISRVNRSALSVLASSGISSLSTTSRPSARKKDARHPAGEFAPDGVASAEHTLEIFADVVLGMSSPGTNVDGNGAIGRTALGPSRPGSSASVSAIRRAPGNSSWKASSPRRSLGRSVLPDLTSMAKSPWGIVR